MNESEYHSITCKLESVVEDVVTLRLLDETTFAAIQRQFPNCVWSVSTVTDGPLKEEN